MGLVAKRYAGESVVITVQPSDKPTRIEVVVTETASRWAKLDVLADRSVVSAYRLEVQREIDRRDTEARA